MRQHAALKPHISDECTVCGQCYKYCPVEAIRLTETKAEIDDDKCIGCAECVAVCRFGAAKFDWGAESELLQKNIAEHSLGVVKGKEKNSVFFDYAISVTRDCDCFGTVDMPAIVDDIGILASSDPVAVDKAAMDMIEQQGGAKLAKLVKYEQLDPRHQFEHAEKIGLGSTAYELINVD